MAIRVFLANSRVILLDSLQVLLEIQQDIKVIGKATNGHEAVKRIQNLKPDVAILDVGLVGLNGIEASLKIGGPSRSTAIVILATTASPEFIFRALRAGARGYLSREASGLELVKDRKSTRLNSSHVRISYAVFCLKKKKTLHKQGWRAANTLRAQALADD